MPFIDNLGPDCIVLNFLKKELYKIHVHLLGNLILYLSLDVLKSSHLLVNVNSVNIYNE